MRGTVTALLIFHHTKLCTDLEAALEKLACHILSTANLPLVVFTESELPDGNWADVVSLSARAASPVSVIVMGQEIDTKLYVSVIEGGAFDFMAPPFKAPDLAHVVRCAADNALLRRQAGTNS